MVQLRAAFVRMCLEDTTTNSEEGMINVHQTESCEF